MTHLKHLLRGIALMVAALTAGPAGAQEGEIRLRVDGDLGTRFSGSCELGSTGDGKTLVLIEEDSVPYDVAFRGTRLSCTIASKAAIEVEVVKGGSRSHSKTSGGTVRVNVGS